MNIENLLVIINKSEAGRNAQLGEFGYLSGGNNFLDLDVVGATLNRPAFTDAAKEEIVQIVICG